ncbi:MAG TPA: DUF805 domain-containing protein [Steroidobacteraceae bacterium]|nr:DUF805 domain-containing protein [Steroidobacteraceae bacterium]
MDFGKAIGTCFTKYATFDGRASRSEFWWFILFTWLATAALSILSPALSWVFQIGVILPTLAAGARRLHDTDRSGWFQLMWLIPLVGWIIVIVFMCQPPKEPNRFGS